MKYDFDRVCDRRNTNSLKYDFAEERGKPADLLPLWVADMDFRVPDEVVETLKARAEHGIFGYSEPKEDYFQTLSAWFRSRHGWNADPKAFVLTCSVVFAICSLLRAVTEEGDAVVICQPVYYPFASAVTENRRKLVVSELKNDGGHYTVDFEDFERKIVQNGVKAFILCNPHNPVGRVWTEEELRRMGDICLKHDVFVIADEIHADFVYGQSRHVAFPTLGRAYEENCAVCTAPTKSFNLAGLHIANTYIADETVRRKFANELSAQGYSQPNVMGMAACQTAYTFGAEWLDELKAYLAENIRFVGEYVAENLPEVDFTQPQGTYLVWLDFRRTGLSDRELQSLVQNKAKLWLDDGYLFGRGGSGFQRINVACPRSVLKEALDRLGSALKTIG